MFRETCNTFRVKYNYFKYNLRVKIQNKVEYAKRVEFYVMNVLYD